MKKNILLYKKIPEIYMNKLQEYFNVHYFDGLNQNNKEQFTLAIKNADGLIGSSVDIKADLLDQAPHLKAISTISVGYDNFDIEDLSNRKIWLMNTPDVLTDTTADLIFTLILTTARRAVELSIMVRERKWDRSITPNYYGIDVHHKTIGIIGMGRIGLAVAKRAFKGFDMNILYTSNRKNIDAEKLYSARYCHLDELLINSDFVCITLPLSASTRKLISKDKIELMKPTAILINGARGQIIDQDALIQALKEKRIRAAGLDVFESEPLPKDSPLLEIDNVVLFPHIGSATEETRNRMVSCAVDNLISALVFGIPPSNNLVNRNM